MKDMMNNKYITGFVILAVAVISLVVVSLSNKEQHDDMMSSTGDMGSKSAQQSSNEVIETNQVSYEDFRVMPQTIKIKKGTTVTWTNKDTAKHDVTPVQETEEFEASELFGKGETYSVTFNAVGTYDYYCSPHPYMKGTVEVIE